MAITELPTPPLRSDPTNFAQRGDAFLAALPAFATQANTLQADVNSKQSTASAAATTATTQATNASTSAAAALASKNASATSETNALSSKNAAATSATTASTQADNSSASAAASLASKNASATSETNALASKNAAATSATASAASATTASTQAGTATTKAGEASTSAANASTSASSALSSKNAAATSETNALASKAAAEAALDSFDDKYLGAKSSAPTVDNDGNTIISGALYWDTVINSGCLRVRQGSSWVTIPANIASTVSSTPSGSLVATNVQDALNELDLEKAIAANFTNVNNTSDANKPVSTAQQAADLETLSMSKAYTDNAILPESVQSLHSGDIVKLFAYDTANDSDGGAWVKRCQDKSWYKEDLGGNKWIGQKATLALAWATSGAAINAVYQNTSDKKFYSLRGTSSAPSQVEVFRGISREFPVTSMIVAESGRVIIYDTSTIGCPMWMVFFTPNVSSGVLGFASSATAPSVLAAAMVNSILIIGTSLGGLLISFLSDDTKLMYVTKNELKTGSNVSNRNGYTETTTSSNGYAIAGNSINDIAVTVLDNALIDPATGMRIPTIALATDGGVSVIRDGGTVVNSTAVAVNYCTIKGSQLWYGLSAYENVNHINLIGIAAGFSGNQALYYGLTGATPPLSTSHGPTNAASAISFGAMGNNLGLSLFKPNPSSLTKSLAAYVTNSYNSGWQNGDSRGAWLADTVAETITGSGELVTNGTFDSSDGWTLGATSPAVAPVISNGVLTFNSTSAEYTYARRPVSLVVGKTYTASIRVTAYTSGRYQLFVSGGASGTNGINSIGTRQFTFVANIPNPTIEISRYGGGNNVATFDDFSVKLAEPDRSVKNKPLVLNGTLTKAPVASGANLMAYSGFSASNYFEQEYNSDLDFGTGDCLLFKGWVNITSFAAVNAFMHRALAGSAGGMFIQTATTTGVVLVYGSATTTPVLLLTGSSLPLNTWTLIEVGRLAGFLYLHVNGKLVSSVADATNLTYVNAVTRIGQRLDTSAPTVGSIALVATGATFPSLDQSTHIYRTELALFQLNAQCTIDGTSSTITAMTFDDSTELLQVGTSWGRSSFRDLLRVDSEVSTIGAITTIASSNGAVSIGSTSGSQLNQPSIKLRAELARRVSAARAMGNTLVPFEFDSVTGQTAFVLPKGYTAVSVYSGELKKREGSTKSWTRSFDGFAESINFAVSPGNAVWVSILCKEAK